MEIDGFENEEDLVHIPNWKCASNTYSDLLAPLYLLKLERDCLKNKKQNNISDIDCFCLFYSFVPTQTTNMMAFFSNQIGSLQ